MDILDKIVEKKKLYLKAQMELRPYKAVRTAAENAADGRRVISLYNALRTNKDISIIAEVKKASPSKGVIRPELDHMAIAREYLRSDVQAMSVLTETDFFCGRPEFLSDIRSISNIPLLRKDFIIDDYQIYEAFVLGADAILLIAAILDDDKMKSFMRTADSLGLEYLVEVHNSEEMRRVTAMGVDILGINNRNLKTFEEDLSTTKRLITALEDRDKKAVVSESGIRTSVDLDYISSLGADGALIGELFMRRDNISRAVGDLREGRL